MDGEGNSEKNIVKGSLKSSLKTILIVVVIAALILGLIPMIYVILKDDFDKLSEKTSTYSFAIGSNGQITYLKEDEEGNKIPITEEEMTEELKGILKDYIGGDDEEYKEKIEYLIGAEAVTKMPYIESSGDTEHSLVGQIKFYRFNSENDASNAYETDTEENKIIKDSYRLTYVDSATFETQKQSYESSGNEEVFKHFTMDDESNVIIAYGKKETRNITTGDSTYAADSELTLETIKEVSGENSYSGDYKNGFSMVRYTVFEKSIDYLSLVEQYVMPTNLLYSLLIQTKDINFVEAIAGLAYENEIAIGIYDNESESNTTETYTYKKMLEMNATTKLDFSQISTSEPDAPAIRPSNLYNNSYSNVPYRCQLVTDNGRASHQMYYYRSWDGATPSQYTDDVFYVKGLNENAQVTGLTTEANAQQFIVKYNQQINATSTPTIGVILADTWIARWEASYYKEDLEPSNSSSNSTSEEILIQEYVDKDDVLNAFEKVASDAISSKLSNHSENLKTNAIGRIVECTDFSVTVSAETITAEDVTVATKKNLLSEHKNSCTQCTNRINLWWTRNTTPTIDQIYLAVTNGNLKETIVETHFLEEIENYVKEKNEEAEREARERAKQREEKRKENFENKLKEQITYTQTLTGKKYDVNIESNNSYTRTVSEYKREETIETTQIGEKFSEVFNDPKFYDARQAILERDAWLWEYIRENDDTAKLENIIRYLLNIATNSERFGKFTEEEINDLFKAFEPKKLLSTNLVAGTFSPFGCMITREEFIEAANNYDGGSSYYKLANAAADFYDVCTQEKYNVNPCLAFAWACVETGYGSGIPYNNLFGMAVYNGQNSGTRYASYADSIEDFCRWVINNANSSSTISHAQEYATVNPKFSGTPQNNVYALFCRYAYLGNTHIADEPDFNNPAGIEYYKANGSTWGAGGRIYIYYMYECGGIYSGEYATRCGHSNGSDPTTLQEKADYVQYTIDARAKIAKSIFGNGIFVGAEGEFQLIEDDPDRYGIYTSSSGRVITGWKQTTASNNSYGRLPLFSWNDKANRYYWMGECGCNVYADTMLLNSVGLDVNPGIVHAAYKSFSGQNDIGTMEKIMKENGVNGDVVTLYQSQYDEFLDVLLSGRVVTTWVAPGFGNLYTSLYHWIALVDIRETQLGSSYGYDIFALTSGYNRGHGWQILETVVDNLQSSSFLCYYIQEK